MMVQKTIGEIIILEVIPKFEILRLHAHHCTLVSRPAPITNFEIYFYVFERVTNDGEISGIFLVFPDTLFLICWIHVVKHAENDGEVRIWRSDLVLKF